MAFHLLSHLGDLVTEEDENVSKSVDDVGDKVDDESDLEV